MALGEFIRNVKRGLSNMGPAEVVHVPPLPRPEQLRLDLWLTLGTVNGFDAADFRTMPAPDRAELSAAVAAFQQAARGVNPTLPATPEGVEAGAAELGRIGRILGKHGYLPS